MKIFIRHALLILILFLIIGALCTGCAANKGVTNNESPVEPAMLPFVPDKDVGYLYEAYDPWEGFNRRMYIFNYYFDKHFFLPIVTGYEYITPDYVEDRITSFFQNLRELKNFTNCLFQFELKDTGVTLGRFLTNSTIGMAGFYDPATHFGWEHRNEDFGQTLGIYGLGPGPYLVLPVFGPSSLRDASGLLVDTAVKTLAYDTVLDNTSKKSSITLGVNSLSAIDVRHRVAFRYYKSGSPFEYELVRRLYLDLRDIQIAK